MLKLSRDRDIPSNTDWYVMKVAMEVRRILYSLSNNNSSITLGDFLLPTLKEAMEKTQAKPPSEEDMQAQIDISKQFWMSLAGHKPQ